MSSSSAGSTDAVDVVFDCLRHVEIDDEVNVLDVEATARHVSGHQDFGGARCHGLLEEQNGFVTLVLRLIAVNSLGHYVEAFKLLLVLAKAVDH